jgi:hypothetical protein
MRIHPEKAPRDKGTPLRVGAAILLLIAFIFGVSCLLAANEHPSSSVEPILPTISPRPLDPSREHRPTRHRVVVFPGSWRAETVRSSGAPFRAKESWPADIEAKLADHPEALEVMGSLLPTGGIAPDGRELAAAHGLTVESVDPDEEPWLALVALEVERASAFTDFMDELLLAHRSKGTTPPPELDYARVLEAARRAQTTWPDHPLAQYARLYELEALGNRMANSYDPTQVGPRAFTALEQASEVQLWNRTLEILVRAHPEGLQREDLESLLELFDDPDLRFPKWEFARYGLEKSLEAGWLDLSASWMSRFDKLSAEECATDPACGQQLQERDAALAYLVAQNRAAPESWQVSLASLVHSCWADGSRAEEETTGIGSRLRGSWRWVWSLHSELTTCVESRAMPDPVAPDGVEVELSIRVDE